MTPVKRAKSTDFCETCKQSHGPILRRKMTYSTEKDHKGAIG